MKIAYRKDIIGFLQERQKLKRFKIECKREYTTLFYYNYPKQQLRIVNSRYSKKVTDVLDRCGIVDLRCEYYPSRLTSEQGIKYDSMELPNFDTWFKTNVENKQEIFVDTNMIIYHTISRVLLGKVPGFKDIIRRIKIPRLVLLEIEAKFNSARKKYDSALERKKSFGHTISEQKTQKGSKKKLEANKEKLEESLEEHGAEMRLMISAQTEVQILKSLSAETIFLPLSTELLAEFNKQAGQGFADPFIRKEILDSTGGGQPFLAAFLTRDLMNALAACAENLDTFYFSHANPGQSIFALNNDQIADVIFESAITFGEVKIYGLIPRKVVVLEGMWPTKSNIDWVEGRARMRTW
jgi:rRNA-processing protein FCF1